MLKKAILGLSVVALMSPMVSAKDDYLMDTDDIGRTHDGVVSSDQFLELGMNGANSLRMEGEQAMRMGHGDKAIQVLQRSVEMAPGDIDGRILYAQALEHKLIAQKQRDPALFNHLVKQWLFVARKSEFADQTMIGRSHLQNLTGVQPKLFENDQKYLSRVLLPEDGSEKVALGKSKDPNKHSQGLGSLETFFRRM